MKKLLSMLLALCLAIPLALSPASASAVQVPSPPVVDEPRVELIDSYVLPPRDGEASPRIVNYYETKTVGDGRYVEVASAQLRAGRTVTVDALWNPSYETLWVRLSGPGHDKSTGLNISISTRATFTVPSNGVYTLWVSTLSEDTIAYLNVDW